MKKKIIRGLATIPVTAGLTIRGSYASGCPFNRNGYCPGRCGHFIDSDGNGNCDLIQSTTDTTTSDIASSSDSSNSAAQDNFNADGSSAQDIGNNSLDYDVNISTPQDSSIFGDNTIEPTNYHAIPVSILILSAYLFTYYLFRKNILTPQKHKKIWNLLLMGGYIGTGITGILLVFFINMGISTIYNQNITFWHAELAILMVVGTLIHLHIYQKPLKKIFKVLFSFKSNSKKKNSINSPNKSK